MAEAPRVSGIRPGIAYVLGDEEWARRLGLDLAAAGVEEVTQYPVPQMAPPGATGAEPLSEGGAMIALLTPASIQANAIFAEINRFEAEARGSGREDPLLISIVFGADLAEMLVDQIQMRRILLVDRAVYEAKDFDSPDWRRAVENVLQALDRAAEESPQEPQEPPPESPDQVLRHARIGIDVLDGGGAGWLLGDDLAVTTVDGGVTGQELRIRSEFGETRGIVSPWAEPDAAGPHDLTLLRLNPVLDLTQALPVDLPRIGSRIEIWSLDLRREAGGSVAEEASDGSFELIATDGKIESGPVVWAAWDVEAGRYVGVASRVGTDWRLFPLTGLRRMAGKPAHSAAIRPPSARIHADSWTIDDRLDYALYGRAIKEFVEHPDTTPPLVIGVQGPWGQGKTSLMRIAQDRLDHLHADLVARSKGTASAVEAPSEMTLGDLRDSLDGDIEIESAVPAEVRSVWFNPWKYQSSEALWAGLAHAILTQLPARLDRRDQELFWLKLQFHRIDAVAVRRDIHRLIFDRLLPGLVVSLLVAVTFALACLIAGAGAALGAVAGLAGGSMTAALSWLLVRRKALEGRLEGRYLRYVRQPDYEGKMGYLHQVEQDVRAALQLLTRPGQPTVIFIDDLDRCGAEKISEVLEAINLFLSGDYPNCVFVLGVDAQVVASAMENVQRQALGGEEKSEVLGWRFLDKFIQLSFVMPRLSPKQLEVYMASLIDTDDGAVDGGDEETLMDSAEDVRRDLAAGRIEAEQAAKRIGGLAEVTTARQRAIRRIAEDVITLGARDFSDSDPDANESLRRRLVYLSDNPRTIKRAVNLYRFYRFIAWARQAAASDLDSADPDLIAGWTVVAARWPQVVHWLQAAARDDDDPEQLLRSRWGDVEPELCDFLAQEPNFDLVRAKDCGLW